MMRIAKPVTLPARFFLGAPPTEVYPDLWISGAPMVGGEQLAAMGLESIVVCAVELVEGDTRRHLAPLNYVDAGIDDILRITPQMAQKMKAGAYAAHAMRNAGPTLVCCAQGVNRSATVAALSLTPFMSGSEALRLIKHKRPDTFRNDVFAEQVAALPQGRSFKVNPTRG